MQDTPSPPPRRERPTAGPTCRESGYLKKIRTELPVGLIVQTPGLIVILYETLTMFRQIFTDGRELPSDPQPSWMGYSVGRWEGDTLVVHTAGFNDKSWLDGSGHPHSDAMHLTERFRRRDMGHMDIQITIDDSKSYTKPLTYTQGQQLLPDTELIEYICNENNEANFPHIFDKK